MSENVTLHNTLKMQYPHVFDPFVRAFGCLPKCTWHDYVDKKYHQHVDKLIAMLRRKSMKYDKTPVLHKSYNEFFSGILPV